MKSVGNIGKDVAGSVQASTTDTTDFVTPVPNYVPADSFDPVEYFGLVTLASLRTDHMDAAGKAELAAVMERVRTYRERLADTPDAAFILLGGYGIGKSHIAKAVHDSVSEVALPVTDNGMIDLNDKQTISLRRYSKFYRASELMNVFETELGFQFAPRQRLTVLDEYGREGVVQFEKRDPEAQQEAKRHYYFNFIDKHVGTCGLFIVSNMNAAQFKASWDGAAYDRLMGMVAPTHYYEMIHVPSYRRETTGRRES